MQHQPVKYEIYPLSPVSRHRLNLVQRKTLVLDLDETLIHSHHDALPRNTVKPGTPHDFTVKVTIDRHPVRFFVHKRPHVDFFLDIVSSIYVICYHSSRLSSYQSDLCTIHHTNSSYFVVFVLMFRYHNGTI